ncbi:MAG: hypothetical protein BRD35_07405 [Bacteroidetes bacterium QH_7_62_13]|nr:MAG: hypothetical protein BRD35_07405 [Bacteroidetes bacterium QH_7_62_13]
MLPRIPQPLQGIDRGEVLDGRDSSGIVGLDEGSKFFLKPFGKIPCFLFGRRLRVDPENWNALKLLNENGEFLTPEQGETVIGKANAQVCP